jgi:hypothetical protein
MARCCMRNDSSERQSLRPLGFAWRLAAVAAPLALLVSVLILGNIDELEVAIGRSAVIAIVVGAAVFVVAFVAVLAVNARLRRARR